jgi:hypothetical protein
MALPNLPLGKTQPVGKCLRNLLPESQHSAPEPPPGNYTGRLFLQRFLSNAERPSLEGAWHIYMCWLIFEIEPFRSSLTRRLRKPLFSHPTIVVVRSLASRESSRLLSSRAKLIAWPLVALGITSLLPNLLPGALLQGLFIVSLHYT